MSADLDRAFEELVRRIEADMPRSTSVTLPEAERLWGLDYATSIAVFRVLTDRGSLRRTPRGQYVRV